VAARIGTAAAGVPLYAEQLLAMLIEQGTLALVDGTWTRHGADDTLTTPPTIAAILAARLDQLDPAGRAVVEAASVIGEVFYPNAVAELAEALSREQVHVSLAALLRRGLVRPEPSDLTGEEAMRFGHVLVRDAAYSGISKSHRADLHVRLARWLSGRADPGPDVYGFTGHHLARAVALRDDLGPRDPATQVLADEAVAVLTRAARRIELSDYEAACQVLDSVAEIVADPVQEAWIRLRQAALMQISSNILRQADFWTAANSAAERAAHDHLRLLITLTGQQLYPSLPGIGITEMRPEQVDASIRRFRETGDDTALIVALNARSARLQELARWDADGQLWQEVEAAAMRLGDQTWVNAARVESTVALVYGSGPVAEGLARLEVLRADPSLQSRYVQLDFAVRRVALLAVADRVPEAYELAARCRGEARDLHAPATIVGWMLGTAMCQIRDFAQAEADIRPSVEAFERVGELSYLSTQLPQLGLALRGLVRRDEAWSCARRAREICPPDDTESQALWRSLTALLLSDDGDHVTACRLSEEAVGWSRNSDNVDGIADRLIEAAEVQEAAGHGELAQTSLTEAIQVCVPRGNLIAQRHARERLAAM
jgi:tetratricopeptide (TPR) repeat protein